MKQLKLMYLALLQLILLRSITEVLPLRIYPIHIRFPTVPIFDVVKCADYQNFLLLVPYLAIKPGMFQSKNSRK